MFRYNFKHEALHIFLVGATCGWWLVVMMLIDNRKHKRMMRR